MSLTQTEKLSKSTKENLGNNKLKKFTSILILVYLGGGGGGGGRDNKMNQYTLYAVANAPVPGSEFKRYSTGKSISKYCTLT